MQPLFKIENLSSGLHHLAGQDWPVEVEANTQSEWLGKTLAVQGSLSLNKVTKQIEDFMRANPQALNAQLIEDVWIVANKLQERKINIIPLQELLRTQAPQGSFITLKEDSQELQMPKTLLIEKCPYFKAMLTLSLKEATMAEVQLQGDSPEAIVPFFSFLKTGKIHLTEKNVLDILEIADKYRVQDLKETCEHWMIQHSDLKEQQEELWNSALQFNASILKEAMIKKAIIAFTKHPSMNSYEATWIALKGKDFNILDLRNLDIYPKEINFLLQYCPNVTHINLAKCNKLTDASIKAIAEKLSNLTSLNLEGCWQLTDASIQVIADKGGKLTYLNLAGCYNLTDASLQAIAEKLRNLTYLNVLGCSKLTEASDQAIAEKLRNLTYLSLIRHRQLTDASIQVIAKKRIKLLALKLA